MQWRNVAGVAVAYSADESEACIVASVLSTTNWKVVHEQRATLPVPRAREPEMQGFREGPMILDVLTKLAIEPDMIFVLGDGIAHPRRFGLACHVGVALDHPTVGVSSLWPPGTRMATTVTRVMSRATKTALRHDPNGDVVGYVVCTQDNQPPIHVSPGHRVSVDDAVSFVLRAAPWYRLPEPLRRAEEAARG
jgi:deoxyribonuclease V